MRGERMQKLVCDRCGRTYTDKEDIDLAVSWAEKWKEESKAEGFEVRGLAPCPNLACVGELKLEEVK